MAATQQQRGGQAPAKRRRKRNTRTAEVVSSSSSSEPSSESSSSEEESQEESKEERQPKQKETKIAVSNTKKGGPQVEPLEIETRKKTKQKSTVPTEILDEEDSEESIDQEAEDLPKDTSSQDFNSWYLRKVAQELEDDLDKIRGSGDFNESSLPILINALQQGESIFSVEEKRRIVGKS